MQPQTDTTFRPPMPELGALELGAMTPAADDGALERLSGPQHQTGKAYYGCGPVIDDAALESSIHAGPPQQTVSPFRPMCRFQGAEDDAALESAAATEPTVTRSFMDPRCRHIDAALEQAGNPQRMGPPTTKLPGRPGCF